MIVECPNCGKPVKVNGLGRKPLNIGVKNVYDTLRDCHSVTQAAKKLGCSRGYIYQEMKKRGLTLREVIQEK